MKEFARSFYLSTAWRSCREAYAKSVGGLCERCLARGMYVPGEIVHHKVHITPENIHDPNVTLAWSNLELVCRNCHADEHSRTEKRYRVDESGKIISK